MHFVDVVGDRLAEALREHHWHGVADLPGGRAQAADKGEVAGKCLQRRGLPNTNGAILQRVTEPPVAETGAFCRKHRSGCVPAHATVYIFVPRVVAMTVKDQVGRPVEPAAAFS